MTVPTPPAPVSDIPKVDPTLPLPQAAAQALALQKEAERQQAEQARELLVAKARDVAAARLAPMSLAAATVVLTRVADGLVVLRQDGLTFGMYPQSGEVRLVTVLDGQVERRSEPLRSLADLGAELGRG